MVRTMTSALLNWRDQSDIHCVMVRSSSEKAYCAGGDIRFFYQKGKATAIEGAALIEDFFTEEYTLNHLIHHYPKPYIALMDGVVMGGGMGIAQAGPTCRLRVVTERTKMAMPEVAIGLFPDVGGGYFLSRAYVPEQEVADGNITIKVVEGYIGKIELENPEQNNFVVKELIRSFKKQRPVKVDQIESFLLRLNDLPGQSFKGVLSNLESDDEGAAKMTLVTTESNSSGGYVNIDNYGSRFIGPSEFSAAYSFSPAPLNQTNISVSSSLPMDEVKYGSFEQITVVSPEVKLGINFTKTSAHPGYTLEALNVDSRANTFGFNAYYQLLRQRQENLSLKFSFDSNRSIRSKRSQCFIYGDPFDSIDLFEPKLNVAVN
jgi:hypothetical protein